MPLQEAKKTTPLNIILIGYGKMGKEIEPVARERGHQILLAIDVHNSNLLTEATLQKADVAIEFTGPDTAVANLQTCIRAKTPVVCGSTGWLSHWDEVEKACKQAGSALLYASNFSVGVNIFFELNKKLAQLMSHYPNYDVKIEETHHTQKKDSPSGTAITLASQIIENNPSKKSWTNNQPSEKDQLQIISKRIDPAPGIHSISYSSSIDDITIIHNAHNRHGFALGAVLAAEFIAGKKGIFNMQDVLGIK